ncbi:MAG: hypothetical protein KAQ96_04705 [Thermoplasmata archaeon]|nr:hypothetical protein [Thermoplasmata archaeon]
MDIFGTRTITSRRGRSFGVPTLVDEKVPDMDRYVAAVLDILGLEVRG